MTICVDVDLDEQGNIVARHLVHTHHIPGMECAHPDGKTGLIKGCDAFFEYVKHPEYHKESGWDQISKHPDYPGKTRMEVALSELERLKDRNALEVLGILI
jgi:hypothetical protein